MAALVAAFGLGRLSTAPEEGLSVFSRATPHRLGLIQDPGHPTDPRELIPLPLPGPDEHGQQLPGRQGQQECPLYFFQDGQFFELRPGEPGPPGPYGQGTPELFPLDPLPEAPAPRRPEPQRPDPPPSGPPPPFFGAPGVAQAPPSAPQLIAAQPVARSGFPFDWNASGFRWSGR